MIGRKIFILLLVLILADQLAKQYILSNNLAFQINSGIALSIFEGNNTLSFCISFVALILVGIDFWRNYQQKQRTSIILWTVVLIFSGGISNLLDRLIYGGVVDFIAIGNLPIFNFGDIFITSGILLIIIANLINKRIHATT